MKRLLACAAILLAANAAHAQGIAINTTGAAADTSAILDLASTTKGLLVPRMTVAQRAAIVLPATGLVVYQTDGAAGLYWNAGTPAAPSWKQVGEAGAGGGSSQWTTNGANIYYSAGNVGIQRSAPLARLDVLGGNWDVVNGEGDVRIGDATTRLKIGIATGGGGTGAATIMEHGPAGAYNVLSLGSQGNKVLHINGNSQRVGIGIDAPSAPLGFAALLGKKITLFPAGANDYGFGISSGRLQIFTDGGAGGDVAIGTDAAGTFTERLAVKNNGALAVSGNTGAAGQVLQSNGSGAAATWVNPQAAGYANMYQLTSTTITTFTAGAADATVPGLSQAITVSGNAKAVINFSLALYNQTCAFCGDATVDAGIALDGVVQHIERWVIHNGVISSGSGAYMVSMGPGAHTISIVARVTGKDVSIGNAPARYGNAMTIQVVQQ
jgi:hypothetical protein